MPLLSIDFSFWKVNGNLSVLFCMFFFFFSDKWVLCKMFPASPLKYIFCDLFVRIHGLKKKKGISRNGFISKQKVKSLHML